MKFYNLDSFYIVSDINDYDTKKDKLIQLIKDSEYFSCYTDLDKISSTDWKLSNNSNREYVKFFYDMITPQIKELSTKMKFRKCIINNTWFQIYKKYDNHTWHVHNGSNWTNVFYVKLPENKIKTEIYDIKNERIINDIEVKEGQLLTLPAGVLHRSPKNELNEEKIIISFNSDFDDLALTI